MAHSKDKIEEMKFTIVISKDARSLASWKIYEALQRQMQSSGRGAGSAGLGARDSGQNIKFHISDKEIIYVDVSKQEKGTDFFIFASTHRSEQHNKTLTVHPIGNWNKADLGGEERMLCGSSAHLLKIFFQELARQANEAGIPYQCSLEATHHGPYVQKPALFIEIGSGEEEWNDKEAAQVVAKAILSGIERFSSQGKREAREMKQDTEKWKTAIAFGGGHYCQAFNKLVLEGEYAISHICSKYALPHLDEEMLKQAIGVTKEQVTYALLDWKGLAGEKQRLIALLEKAGLEYVRA